MKRLQCLVLASVLGAVLPVSSWGAAPEGLSAAQADALEQRVRARWLALSSGDYEKVWEFSTPVYRSVFPKDMYVLRFSYTVQRELTGVEVLDYDAAAAVASVTARVMSKPIKQTSAASQALGAVPVTVHERWIFIDSEWWFGADG